MAILSDREIWSLIREGRVKVDPPPAPESVSPSTIDLTLSSRFRIPKEQRRSVQVMVDMRDSAAAMDALADFSDEEEIAEGEAFVLKRGAFALAWTRERIGLPNFLAARIEGRSTPARLGLSVHQSAPTVHPTWLGQLQLELTNAGPFDLQLYPGEPICQLILETMSIPSVSTLRSTHLES